MASEFSQNEEIFRGKRKMETVGFAIRQIRANRESTNIEE